MSKFGSDHNLVCTQAVYLDKGSLFYSVQDYTYTKVHVLLKGYLLLV